VIVSLLTKNMARPETIRFFMTERGQLVIVGVWVMILFAVDVGLVLLAWVRFRRDQLIEIR